MRFSLSEILYFRINNVFLNRRLVHYITLPELLVICLYIHLGWTLFCILKWDEYVPQTWQYCKFCQTLTVTKLCSNHRGSRIVRLEWEDGRVSDTVERDYIAYQFKSFYFPFGLCTIRHQIKALNSNSLHPT